MTKPDQTILNHKIVTFNQISEFYKDIRKPTNTDQNLVRPGTLVKPGFLFVEATWFKQCKLVKPRYLGFQRLLA